MRILLTGSSGMVGKNILEHPIAGRYEILNPNRSVLDLLSLSAVEKYLKANEPDLIVHCAGLVGGIQDNIERPTKFLVENALMGMNLMSAAQLAGIKNLINLGSSCMYPRDVKNPLKEDAILTGELEPTNEGYALAKIMSAKLCDYISATDNDLSFKTVIPCNLYGRHDKFGDASSHMVPAVIKKIHSASNRGISSVDIWGDGLARREFMYAGDFASFIFYAIENFDRMPGTINVGLGRDYSIREYYETVASIVGFDGQFTLDTTRPVGMRQKLVDITRLESFGWRHQVSLESGIKHTWDYYKGLSDVNL